MSGIKIVPSVFAIVEKDGKYLLLRRSGTGFMDGWYDLPAGHLEDQEKLRDGAARELKEETSIITESKDLKLVHLYQNHSDEPAHYGHIFLAKKWRGEPKIMEPAKCDRMAFFAVAELPEKTLPYSREALENLGKSEVGLSYHEPGSLIQ